MIEERKLEMSGFKEYKKKHYFHAWTKGKVYEHLNFFFSNVAFIGLNQKKMEFQPPYPELINRKKNLFKVKAFF